MATGTMPPQTFWFALALLTLILFSRSSTALPSENLNSREAAHLDKRQWTSRGIQIIPGKCTGPQLTAMKNAILDASYLAGAGINAAADFDNVPFSYFFKSDYATGNTVAGVLQRVMHSQQGQGDLIGATCEDVYSYCSPNGRAQPAYSVQAPGTGTAAIIVVCPLGLSLKRNLVRCTANPSAISLG